MFKNIICILFVAALVPMNSNVSFAENNKLKDAQSLRYEFEDSGEPVTAPKKPAPCRKVIMAPCGRPADCCGTVYYPRCRPAVVAVPCYAVPYPYYVTAYPCCRPTPCVPYPYYGYRRCRW